MNTQSFDGASNLIEGRILSRNDSARVKLRKGTSSCWECKHRKKKCTYGPGSPSTCDYCQRFGLECVNQKDPDPRNHGYDKVLRSIVHVEGLVDQLLRQKEPQSAGVNPETRHRKKQAMNYSGYPTLKSVCHERLSRGRSLTGYLESLLPNPAVSVVILSSRKLFSSPLQAARQPENSRLPGTTNSNCDIPSTAHPLEYAQRLLQLALCLKQFDAASAQQLQQHLGQPVNAAAQRFFNAATHYVLSQDYLVASLEGLETLILQSRWCSTNGDFKMASAIQRRATKIALSIDILKLIESDSRAEHLWFQIAFGERFLSLMLGIPFANTSESFAHPNKLATNNATQKLERVHTLLAGHLISRNLRIQNSDFEQQKRTTIVKEYNETRRIDNQLKQAARLMPTKWWHIPSLTDVQSDIELSRETGNILLQMHQYYLLVLLHLPYTVPKDDKGCDKIDYTYSKLTAISACRETLHCYLACRNFHHSPSYQALDEKAFIVGVTLLFIHLNGHASGNANFFEHSRAADLAILEQVVHLLDRLCGLKNNVNCAAHSKVLKEFMKIEENAAYGSSYEVSQEYEIDDSLSVPNNDCLRLPIPYFGTLSISSAQSKIPPEDSGGLHTETGSSVSGF